MRILIVDDEPINIFLLESLLQKKYDLSTAEHGLDGYNKALQENPDIILLDVLMPYMDGFETLEKLKKNPKTKNIAVIMVTAKVEKEDVKHALTLGASDYIKKPIDATELYTKVDLHARLRKKEKQLNEYQVYANIHESMLSAQRIQQSLLPDKEHFLRIFPNSFSLFLPKDMVSGDFYFIAENYPKKFICVFDSTGHGVPAAMITMLGYNSLHWIVNKNQITDPKIVATMLRQELTKLLSENSDTYASMRGMDAIFCEYDIHTKELCYVGARRPLVLARNEENDLQVDELLIDSYKAKDGYSIFHLKGDLNSITAEDSHDFIKHKVQLKTDDRIYMFSDGFTDQFGGDREKKFSKKQLINLLLDVQNKKIRSQKLPIYNKLTEWSKNNEQTDDIVFIGVDFD